jgi:hypothetical protein
MTGRSEKKWQFLGLQRGVTLSGNIFKNEFKKKKKIYHITYIHATYH